MTMLLVTTHISVVSVPMLKELRWMSVSLCWTQPCSNDRHLNQHVRARWVNGGQGGTHGEGLVCMPALR